MAGDSASKSAAPTIAQLEKTRSAHKGHLTKLEVHIADHETGKQLLSEVGCEQMIAKIHSLESKISDVNERIYELTTAADLDDAVTDSYEIELRITNLLTRLGEIKLNFPPSAPSSAISHSASSTHFAVPQVSQVKLPSFDLPKFNGAFEEWLNFQDIFLATIDSHTALTDAQKLQYLKSCVQGEAASLISSYPLTSGHYAQAWTSLTKHYDNKRRITLAILKKLSSIQPLKVESASGLQKILMVTQECLDKLSVLGYPVPMWDVLLVYHLMEK